MKKEKKYLKLIRKYKNKTKDINSYLKISAIYAHGNYKSSSKKYYEKAKSLYQKTKTSYEINVFKHKIEKNFYKKYLKILEKTNDELDEETQLVKNKDDSKFKNIKSVYHYKSKSCEINDQEKLMKYKTSLDISSNKSDNNFFIKSLEKNINNVYTKKNISRNDCYDQTYEDSCTRKTYIESTRSNNSEMFDIDNNSINLQQETNKKEQLIDLEEEVTKLQEIIDRVENATDTEEDKDFLKQIFHIPSDITIEVYFIQEEFHSYNTPTKNKISNINYDDIQDIEAAIEKNNNKKYEIKCFLKNFYTENKENYLTNNTHPKDCDLLYSSPIKSLKDLSILNISQNNEYENSYEKNELLSVIYEESPSRSYIDHNMMGQVKNMLEIEDIIGIKYE